VIDLTQDLDTIWKKMSKTCRSSINTAREYGEIIRMNQGYDTFLKMYSEFRREKGLDDFTVDIEFMKKNGILVLSEYEGKIIGGEFYITDGKNMRTLLSGSIRLEETGKMRTLVGNANRLRIWEIIVYGKTMGMSTFDMGGFYTGEKPDPQKEGINKFKKSFGGQLVTHYNYQKDYSILYHIGKKILSLKKLL
jgi:lipid II:glycine glycyltransferase (peptidoglycan interpeptide bridge formation enzyme)